MKFKQMINFIMLFQFHTYSHTSRKKIPPKQSNQFWSNYSLLSPLKQYDFHSFYHNGKIMSLLTVTNITSLQSLILLHWIRAIFIFHSARSIPNLSVWLCLCIFIRPESRLFNSCSMKIVFLLPVISVGHTSGKLLRPTPSFWHIQYVMIRTLFGRIKCEGKHDNLTLRTRW